MKILITGAAGFIGFHLVNYLAKRGDSVVGIDSINDYYDVNLKYGRLRASGLEFQTIGDGERLQSLKYPNYQFIKLDITEGEDLNTLFKEERFDAVCNLAAQAGVRYSLTNPHAYLESNMKGFLNILECCRNNQVQHLAYASSSSVYGLNKRMPFSVHHNVDHPVSLYAASKKSNELMAHTYSHLFGVPTTGLRFFTVYGPWGRPDMALFLFTKAIIEGKPIQIFNSGNMKRDFTYIDDIIEGVVRVIDNPAKADGSWDGNLADPATSSAPYRIFNIGRGSSVNLMDFVTEIEKNLGVVAEKDFMPMQDGDVVETWADVQGLENELNYKPSVSVQEGVTAFIEWYKSFYKVSDPVKDVAEPA